MKKLIFCLTAAIIIAGALFTSCSTEEEEEVKKNFDFSQLLLKPNQLNSVLFNIENNKKRNENSKNVDVLKAENEMKTALQPLIENGRIIHNSMLNEINSTIEFQNMTFAEQQEITNLTDEQLVELSFIVNFQAQAQAQGIDGARARGCLATALGIVGIRSLYYNTLALGTVQTMIGALKLIGKRYLGWIGVALMVYDYATCMGEPTAYQEPSEGPGFLEPGPGYQGPRPGYGGYEYVPAE